MVLEMSTVAQRQYANLAQAARQHDLPGGFVTKAIKGHDYW